MTTPDLRISDEEAAIEHHKKVNPWIREDKYFHTKENNQTIAAFLAGIKRGEEKAQGEIADLRARCGMNSGMLAAQIEQGIENRLSFDKTLTAEREQSKKLVEALEYYAGDDAWYLSKDDTTGAEVRRSIEYADTETGGRLDETGRNILIVNGGKKARKALAAYRESAGKGEE